MLTRPSRTVLALSATLALTISALAPTAALAKGPGDNGDCDGDCTADQPQAQQVRARDGSGSGSSQSTQTKANAGGGGQVQARAGNDGNAQAQNKNTQQNRNVQQNKNVNGTGQNAKSGAGQGPNDDGQRGPGTCDECDAEMGTLTDEQAAGVLFMANEEKLAHDVYSVFADQYGLRVFANIANAEARHQQAVKVTLERYGLEDTAFGLATGEFSDPAIASLYATLIERGSASLEEAIAVGVLIEETDIADLQARMVELETTAPDVYQMYSHLLAGSQNHLEAFEGWL
jgi:hypothetical protein